MEIIIIAIIVFFIFKLIESSPFESKNNQTYSQGYDTKANKPNSNYDSYKSKEFKSVTDEKSHTSSVKPYKSRISTREAQSLIKPSYKTKEKRYPNFNTKVKFTINSNKRGHKYYAYTTYYQSKYSYNAPSSIKADRSLVFAFKDGNRSSEVADIITNCIYNAFKNTPWLNSSTIFAIIPASTASNTETRFREFTKLVSSNLSLTNGYFAIQRINDREKMTELGHSISRVDGLRFNRTIISGNRVILFDDVITRGGSLNEISNELKRFGATNVIGVFLAETYDSWKHGDPDWHN